MAKRKRKKAKKKLKKFGEDILKYVDEGENPRIEIPVRSLSNVEFDEESERLSLGDKTSRRYFFNVAHSKKFMQTLLVAAFCNDLLKEDLHTSLRDLFYALKRTLPNSDENTFNEQSDSNPIIVDLEVALDVLREQLHLNANTRGRVVGKVKIKDRGDTINWARLGTGGWHIPSNVEDIAFKKVDADYLLVVEKNAVWERLNEDKFWKKHKCILLGVQGQPGRGARRLIQRLASEHDLPVFVLTDLDAYGLYIYSVIKYGSMSLAHISERLGTPNAKFLGLTMDDIDKFNLDKFTIKATEGDIKRAKEMLDYEWFKKPEWQKLLKALIKRKIKAELEALSGRGLRFMSEEYLPTKIQNKEFLD